MKTFNINGYEAYTNSDLINGRGTHIHIGYFVNEIDAMNAAKGKGPMGCNGAVVPVSKTIRICENYADYEKVVVENLKESALSKLTDAEKKALGF